MRRILILAFLASMALAALGQSTTISSSGVVDTDGFTWSHGTYQVSFVPNPSWPSTGTYTWSGGSLQQNALFTGSLDGSGAFSLSVPSNTAITPSGSQWKVTVCPNAQTGCFSINTGTVTGAAQDLTAAINAAAQGPRFPITNYTGYGYGTIEVNPMPLPGTEFYDTTNATCYQFSGPPGNSWAACPNAIGVYVPLAGGTMTGTLTNSAGFIGPLTGLASQNLSLAGGTMTGAITDSFGFIGPLTGSITSQFINGIPQADQFSGVDFCAKLRAANIYAIANGIHLVDATHFTGIQSCSVDPWNTLATAYSTVNLTNLLPAAHIQATVPIVINNSGLRIHGQGPFATQWEYTGANTAYALSYQGAVGNDLWSEQLAEMFIYGGSGNVTDSDLYIYYTHHSDFHNVYTWGAVSGIHTYYAVTDTFYRPRTSNSDAITIGIFGASHTTPTHALNLDGASGLQTTDGTVIDAAAEGLNGVGWLLHQASSMTFTSGTSENNTAGAGNPGGAQIDSTSLHNVFIGSDFESNTANDVLDNGTDNLFQKVICASGFTAGSSSVYSTVDSATCGYSTVSGARFAMHKIGSVIVSNSGNSATYNGGGTGWNRLGQGETDIDTYTNSGPCAVAFYSYSTGFNNLGCVNLDGTLSLSKSPTASSTASNYSVPITLNGTTYYMRLSTTP